MRLLALWLVHRWLTRDSLAGFISGEELKRITKHVEKADVFLTHGLRSCHRVGKYQDEFEGFGGRACRFPGAEEQAARFLSLAESSVGDEMERNLGYAIHHIQDAFCPEHIFPFQENTLFRPFAPHLMYSIHVAKNYQNWSLRVKNAAIIRIASPEDLRDKVKEAADWVRSFPCSYKREDGERVGEIPWTGWQLSQEDTGRWLERAASLTKGAFLYLRERRF